MVSPLIALKRISLHSSYCYLLHGDLRWSSSPFSLSYPFLASCGPQLHPNLYILSFCFFWGGWGGVGVVNPCFTPAAQYARVTVQPVANVMYLRCSSFLHPFNIHWLYCDHVSAMAPCDSNKAEHTRVTGNSELLLMEMLHSP